MTPIQCPNCGRYFESMNAYNGHLAHCKGEGKGVNGGGERELGSISEIMELLEKLSQRGKVKAQGGMKLTFELGVEDILGFLGNIPERKEGQQQAQLQQQQQQQQAQVQVQQEQKERWDWKNILIGIGVCLLIAEGLHRIFGKKECKVGEIKCWQLGATSIGIATFGLKRVKEFKGAIDLVKALKGL